MKENLMKKLMLPSEGENIQRILAIRLDNMGDIVMLSPALRTLRSNLPNVSITLMASPAGSQVAPLLPWVDDVLTSRVVWQDTSGTMPLNPMRETTLIEKIAKRQFNAAIIFTNFSQSPYPPAYLCYLAGIPIRIGQSKQFGGSVLSHWVKPLTNSTHQIDRNLFLLESAGFTVENRYLELKIPAHIQVEADGLLRSKNINPDQPFIVLAPGASYPARRYDIHRYAAVARSLVSKTGLPIVIVGSTRETELIQPLLAGNDQQDNQQPGEWEISSKYCPSPTYFKPENNKIISLVGRTSLPELAGIIQRASLVIANNSGPMHIADALRRPMVILYSGTELESQWQPRNATTKLLRRPTNCSPCYKYRCPYELECLDIPPDEVVKEALDLLDRSLRVEEKVNQFWQNTHSENAYLINK